MSDRAVYCSFPKQTSHPLSGPPPLAASKASRLPRVPPRPEAPRPAAACAALDASRSAADALVTAPARAPSPSPVPLRPPCTGASAPTPREPDSLPARPAGPTGGAPRRRWTRVRAIRRNALAAREGRPTSRTRIIDAESAMSSSRERRAPSTARIARASCRVRAWLHVSAARKLAVWPESTPPTPRGKTGPPQRPRSPILQLANAHELVSDSESSGRRQLACRRLAYY